MNLLPFEQLPPFVPRRLVPASIDLGEWSQIAPLYDRLETQAARAATVAELEQWLIDWGELRAAIDEESSKRYIAMTCHTDDPAAERAFLHFVEQVEPQTKPRQFKLEQIFLRHPCRAQLSKARYAVFDRDTALHVELFRPENIPLETAETQLGQQYQTSCGSLTVQFRGEEKTLVQMGRHLEETDRRTRQEAWELVANRRLQEAERFDGLFDSLVRLREQLAVQAGFPNYLTYAFRARRRFDYTPEDCEKFHAAVEQEVMPLVRELQAQRRERLGLDALRPWDLAVDPLNRQPLRPFDGPDQLVEKTQTVFDRLDPSVGTGFRRLHSLRLLDLANRKGKAPGGYQSALPEARLPFIFMNAVGMQRDVETLLHEAGHAFHVLATQPEPLYAYREAPIEFCEVASMSMELLGGQFLQVFYAPEEEQRARRQHLEGVIHVFPWIATIDAFQHWIYSHPGHTRAERRLAWLDLMDRFGGAVDWTGLEDARANLWHRQLHLFLHPFYYVEYGIAQLGALQIWANAKKDSAGALRAYQRALALGGSRPLPELFAAAECRFDFTAAAMRPLMELIRQELKATASR